MEQQDEIPVENLYTLCLKQETVEVDGATWKVGELLGKFIGNALRILGVPDLVKSINGLMITTPVLTRPMVENIRVACREMGFPRNRCFLQDYEESFYYHTLYQKPEIWSRSVGLFVFDKDEVSYAKLEMNRSTRRPYPPSFPWIVSGSGSRFVSVLQWRSTTFGSSRYSLSFGH